MPPRRVRGCARSYQHEAIACIEAKSAKFVGQHVYAPSNSFFGLSIIMTHDTSPPTDTGAPATVDAATQATHFVDVGTTLHLYNTFQHISQSHHHFHGIPDHQFGSIDAALAEPGPPPSYDSLPFDQRLDDLRRRQERRSQVRSELCPLVALGVMVIVMALIFVYMVNHNGHF